jgi:hypothetical protein
MRIRWNGGGAIRRLVAGYEWSPRTGYEQDVVEDDVAANLLTDPSGLFVAVDGEEAQALFDSMEPADSAEETDPEEVEENGDEPDDFDCESSESDIADWDEDEESEEDSLCEGDSL